MIELQTKKCVEVAALEMEIKKLKANADIQKQHIKYLSSKVYNKEKSKESLNFLLKELREQNILPAKAHETLAVILNIFYDFTVLVDDKKDPFIEIEFYDPQIFLNTSNFPAEA